MMSFTLDPRLKNDTIAIGDAALSRVLLMDDERFPWVILVPRRPDLAELTDLGVCERALLIEEIAAVSTALWQRAGVDKINVGALGNLVRQLHIHVVARTIGDEAWPGPVWGAGPRRPYGAEAREKISQEIAEALHQIVMTRSIREETSVRQVGLRDRTPEDPI
jgi:diadenosine tetraphosphate (Ap4A) HIT family hydrolase